MNGARDVLAFWSGVYLAGALAVIAGLALLLAVPATIGTGLIAARVVAAR